MLSILKKSSQHLTSDQILELELNKLEWELSPAFGGCEFSRLRTILDNNKQLFANIVTLVKFNLDETRYIVRGRNLYRTNPTIQKKGKKLEVVDDKPFWVRILKR